MNNKLYIDINTKKIDLLEQLANKVSVDESIVFLIVNSVPSFINTPIALAIFSRQISNYPKPVFWFSSNQIIVNFLRRCNARIKDPNLTLQTLQTLQLNKANGNSNLKNNTSRNNSKSLNVNQTVNDKSSKPSLVVHNQLVAPEVSFANINLVENNIVKTEPVSKLLEYRNRIRNYQEKIFKRDEQKQLFKEDYINIQDFNSLIQRLEQTKYNLKAAKNTGKSENSTDTKSDINKSRTKNKLVESFNKFRLSLFTFLVFFGAMLLLVNTFFPTKVYTVELVPTAVQDKIQVVLTENSFSKDSRNIIVENSTPTTGTNAINKDFASGAVKISNTGTQVISLTNGGFRLKSGDSTYTQVFDPKLPPIIKLDNNSKDVDISVKADNIDKGTELPSLSNFSLVNLNGDVICSVSNCKVFATTPITTQSDDKKNTVLPADKDVLKQTNLKNLNTKIAAHLADLRGQDSNKVIQNTWYKINSVEETFDHKDGEASPALTLKTQAQVVFYDLSKAKLLDQLKSKIDNSTVANDINIEGSDLDFTPEKNTVNLTVNYTGNRYSRLSDQEIVEIFGNETRIDVMSKQLRDKYPGLGKIEVKEKGLSIPGLNPKINVDIVKK